MFCNEIFNHEGQERKFLDLFGQRRETERADEHITASGDAVEAFYIRRLPLQERGGLEGSSKNIARLNLQPSCL